VKPPYGRRPTIEAHSNSIPVWLKEFTSVHQVISKANDFKIARPVGLALAGRITLLVVVAILGGSFALSKLMTVFQKYDDEGYVLLSLKAYLNGGHLYSDTFSNYGPFYYYAQWIFFRGFIFRFRTMGVDWLRWFIGSYRPYLRDFLSKEYPSQHCSVELRGSALLP
jgi:predicted permease